MNNEDKKLSDKATNYSELHHILIQADNYHVLIHKDSRLGCPKPPHPRVLDANASPPAQRC